MTQENASKPTVTQAPTPPGDLAIALSLVGGILISIGSIGGMGLGFMGRPFF